MMASLRTLWYRIRCRLRRPALDAQLHEEMQFHRDLLARDQVVLGVPADEAKRLAAVRFGNTTQLSEQSRAWWSLGAVEDVLRDLRYAARFLRRTPAFTSVALFSIALGVGANAAVFAVVDRIFFRAPAGVADGGHLRRVYIRTEKPGAPASVRTPISWAEFYAIAGALPSASSIAGYAYPRMTKLGLGLDAPRIAASAATWNYFAMAGVRPALGRFFDEADDRDDAPSTVVLSYALWQRQFAGSDDVVGKTIMLGERPVTIIGVAPRGFDGLEIRTTEAWLPVSVVAREEFGKDWRTFRGSMGTLAVFRLRNDATDTRAEEEAARAINGLPIPRFMEGQKVTVMAGPLIRARGPGVRDSGITVATRLAVAACLVLLAGCANVANLLFARALARRRELAVRLAIGVSRSRLMGEMLAETWLLCVAGGALALFVADVGGRVLRKLILSDVVWAGPPVDSRIVAFTVVAALLFGLVASAIPAWRASRTDLGHALKSAWHDGAIGGRRGRGVLLSLQLAFSVVLLIGAGLFTKSLMRALHMDMGFDPSHTVIITLNTRPSPKTSAEWDVITDGALERLGTLPGVRDVGVSGSMPVYQFSWEELSIPERDAREQLRALGPLIFPVDGGAMRAMGIKLLRGRFITADDRLESPRVVVVSESMARVLWPGADALERCLRIGADTMPCSRVVGVVRDMVTMGLARGLQAAYFVPRTQTTCCGRYVVARVDGDVDAATTRLRLALRGWRDDLSVLNVRPYASVLDEELRPWRLGALVFSIFGVIALVLAAIGVYGIVAFNVTRRTSEFGIRAALGATRMRLARLVLGNTVMLAASGIVVGMVLAVAAAKSLSGLVFQTSAREPVSIGAAAVLLLIVAIVAALGPMRRVTKIDPVRALRVE